MHACRYPIAKCHGDPEPRALPKCWERKGAAGALAAVKDEVWCESSMLPHFHFVAKFSANNLGSVKPIMQIFPRRGWGLFNGICVTISIGFWQHCTGFVHAVASSACVALIGSYCEQRRN